MRDKITEQSSRLLLPGVNVVVVGADVFLDGSTNGQGKKVLSNLLITSGKEMVLEMAPQKSFINMAGVVITAHQNKSQIANEMALVSARVYAESFNAPARMLSGYTGVTGDALANSENVLCYLC